MDCLSGFKSTHKLKDILVVEASLLSQTQAFFHNSDMFEWMELPPLRSYNCFDLPKMLPHLCRILKKCKIFGASDTGVAALLDDPGSIA